MTMGAPPPLRFVLPPRCVAVRCVLPAARKLRRRSPESKLQPVPRPAAWLLVLPERVSLFTQNQCQVTTG